MQAEVHKGEPQVTGGRSSALKLRVLSAAVLIPWAIAVIWFGGWVFALSVAVVSVLMAFEWVRLVSGRRYSAAFVFHALVSLAVVGLTYRGQPAWALAVSLGAVALMLGAGAAGLGRARWLATGLAYTTLPCLSIVWIREEHSQGMGMVLAIVLVVAAIDTGAYWAGKTFGGPKLAPRLSPAKTWAGLLGGAVWASLATSLAAFILALSPLWLYALLGPVVAVLEQAGDIAESAVKRRFRVKDMGSLIPGHGGVLDRLDGLMIVSVVIAVVLFIQEGAGR